MVTSEPISAFLTYLRECEQQYRMAEDDEREANLETQDILHSIELENHDYHSLACLSGELKAVRQKRRASKDTMSTTVPVLEWVDSNRTVIKSLERLLGDVRKAEKNLDNRIYTPRTKRGGVLDEPVGNGSVPEGD